MLLGLLILAGCTAPQSEPALVDSQVGTQVDEEVIGKVVQAHNRLGMVLFSTINKSGEENVFLSPTSIALALSMAYNGADGTTLAAMREAMQWGELSDDQINAASLALLHLLDEASSDETEIGDAGIRMNIANSLWHRLEFAPGEKYLQDVRRFYRALVEGLDFNAAQSVKTINAWVSDATQGLIPTVVDRLDADLLMLLINAVYFKGDWTHPFDTRQTREMPFHLTPQSTRPVPMMHHSGTIDYYEDEGMQAIRLPYGQDERLAMYVYLPKAGLDFDSFVQQITYDTLEDTFDQFTPKYGEVNLPRMDIAYKVRLNDALTALGMGIAFNGGQADFGRMRSDEGPGNLYLGDVIHQSVLKVDEEGTEAAAVTSIEVRVTSMPVYAFRFRADRPFVIAIRDDETGALLFVGAIRDPMRQ